MSISDTKKIYLYWMRKWKETNFDQIIAYDKGPWEELMQQDDADMVKSGLKHEFLFKSVDDDDIYDDDTTIHFNNDELITQLQQLLTHKEYYKWRSWIKEAWNEDPIV